MKERVEPMAQRGSATKHYIDFSRAGDERGKPSGIPGSGGRTGPHAARVGNYNAPRMANGLLLTEKQIRARARRRARRENRRGIEIDRGMTQQEFAILYKPVEEWDLEELAHGRPRDKKGNFGSRMPGWIPREIHEKSMERFKSVIRTEMNKQTPVALEAVQWILGQDDYDPRGRPIVPPSTKLDAAKFLLEHVVGKPVQHIEGDISVKLQAILGSVIGNPADIEMEPDQPGYNMGHMPGYTMPLIEAGVEDAEIVDDDDA